MSARGTGVRVVRRRGKRRLLIDFTYIDSEGRWQRYRHDAPVQTMTGARAEADRLRRLTADTGSPYQAPSPLTVPARVDPPCITFSAFVDGIWANVWKPTYSPATQTRYEDLLRQGIREFFGNKPLNEITGMDVRSYIAQLAVRNVQARPHQSFVSSVLKAAVEAGVLAKLPDTMPRLPPHRKASPDSPSDDEVAAIMGVVEGWLRVAVALAVYAGMRSGEVRALEVRDIDFAKKKLTIRRAMSGKKAKDTKDHEDRAIPIAPPLLPILVDACRDKLPKARVVINQAGTSPKRQDLWNDLAALLKRHGLKHRSFHSLRHYWCSALLDRGIPVPVVSRAMGHSDLKTTQRYVHNLRSLDGVWG
jgi:integrase